MSAVKSRQIRSNFSGSCQLQASVQPHQTFGHYGGETQVGAYPSFNQNLRRSPFVRPTNSAENSCLIAGRPVPSFCASNSNNYVFIQNASQTASAQDGNNHVAGHNFYSHDAHSLKLSESDKQAQIQMMKAYLSDYSDERIRQVLTETNWDTLKALDAMMGENFRQADSANQSRLNETQALYARASQGSSAQEAPANSFSSSYNIPKVSKRRRNQPESSNLPMQSANQSPQRAQASIAAPRQQLQSHQNPSSATAAVQSQSNGSLPGATNTTANSTNSQAAGTSQYRANLAQQLGLMLECQPSQSDKLNIIVQALDHYAEVSVSKTLSMQTAQAAQSQDQLKSLQQEQNRLQHDNKILRKGFQAMIKKQTEWCSTEEHKKKLEKENERLRREMMFLRSQYQPSQATYSSHDMMNNRNNDVC